MKGWMDSLRLYAHYVSVSVRCAMQYKASMLMLTLGQLLVSFAAFFGVSFMFMRFSSVKGYTYGEVLLCFAIVLMQFSLAEMLARGFDTFAGLVRRGEFDRVLVRPRSLILQVLGSKFEITRVGRAIQAVIIFAYAMTTGPVTWSAPKVFTVILMLLGGVVLFSSLFLVYASLCFFTLEGLEFMNVFTDGGREYGKYPVDVYGKRVFQFSTVVIPYALIQYYPLQYLIGRSDNWLLSLCPLGALVFFGACYAFWRCGVAKYQSSGS